MLVAVRTDPQPQENRAAYNLEVKKSVKGQTSCPSKIHKGLSELFKHSIKLEGLDGLGQWSTTFLAPGTGFCRRQFFHGWDMV